MRVFSVTLIAFFAFFEVVICWDNIHGIPWSRRHNSNFDVRAAQQNTALQKRFDGAQFTYYAAGLGACGKVNTASDFVSLFSYKCFFSSWQLNDYVDRCSQCSCKTCLILFVHYYIAHSMLKSNLTEEHTVSRSLLLPLMGSLLKHRSRTGYALF